MYLKNLRRKSIIIYISYLIWFYGTLIFEVEPFCTFSDSFALIGNLMCFPLFYIGIKSHYGNYKRPWRYFFSAALLYFIGEVIWAYYADILGHDPEIPSICDVFYFSATLVCIAGLMSFLKWTQKNNHIHLLSVSFDLLISIFATGGIIYNFVVKPIITEESSSNFLFLFALHYSPVLDVALLAGLFLMLFGSDNKQLFTPVNMLIGMAFLFTFELDQFSLLMNIKGIELHQMMDPLWTVAYMFLALASLYPEAETEEFIKTKIRSNFINKSLEYFKILLPYMLTLSILFMVCFEYNLFNSVFVWAMMLVFLLSLRQVFVLVRNKRLMIRIRHNEEKLNMQNIELQKLNEKVMRDAEIDFLTQLSNRRYIDKSFERLVPQDNQVQFLGILLIDVDFFKQINDTFGHQVGDEVLREVASTIRSVVRNSDIAGRFGGDEFIVLLPGADTLVTEDITKNLVDRVHTNKNLQNKGVTLSIGCTSCQVTRKDYEVSTILKKADNALYKAKENGRNQYVVG